MMLPQACCALVWLTFLAKGLAYTTQFATSCFSGNFELTCDRKHRIHIESDQYGYSSENKCTYTEGDCMVDNEGHRSLTTRYCEGHLSCSPGISVSKRLCSSKFTNYQIIKYNCVPETDVLRLCQVNSFEGNEGFVATPRFPFPYPDNVDCKCTLSTTHSGGVKVEFRSFDVKNNPTGTCRDFVELTNNGKSVKACTKPTTTMLSGKTTLRFVSNSIGESAQGFWMKFSVPPEHKVKVVCGDSMGSRDVSQPPELTSIEPTTKETEEISKTIKLSPTTQTPVMTPEVTTQATVKNAKESTMPASETTAPPVTQSSKEISAMPTPKSNNGGNALVTTVSAGENNENQNSALRDNRNNSTVGSSGGSSGAQNKSAENHTPSAISRDNTSRRDATTEALRNGIIEVEQIDNFTNIYLNESEFTTTAVDVDGSDSTETKTTTETFKTPKVRTVADKLTTVTLRAKKVNWQERVASDGMMKRPPISLFKVPQPKVEKLSEKENTDESANSANSQPAGFNFLTVVMCAVAGVLGIVMFIAGFVSLNKRKKYFRFGSLFGTELASILSSTLGRRTRETETEVHGDSTSINSADTEISDDLSTPPSDTKTVRFEEISEECTSTLKTTSFDHDFKTPVDIRNLAVHHDDPDPNPVIDKRPPALPPRLYQPKEVIFPAEETEVPPPLPAKNASRSHE